MSGSIVERRFLGADCGGGELVPDGDIVGFPDVCKQADFSLAFFLETGRVLSVTVGFEETGFPFCGWRNPSWNLKGRVFEEGGEFLRV